MKKTIVIVSILALLVLAACTTTPNTTGNAVSNPAANAPIEIGFTGPLSGPAASWGENALAGVELAVNEANAKGGINGRQIKLIVEDDKCAPAGMNAIAKLINNDNVDVLIGPVCSAVGGPGLPIAAEAGTPTMVFASAPQLTALGDNLFRVYPSDSFAGKAAVDFTQNEFDAKKSAVVYVLNDWGEAIQAVYEKEFEARGGEVVFSQGITVTDNDFKTLIRKVQQSDAEVLYLPIYPDNAVTLFKQLEELDFDIPIIATEGIAGEEILNTGAAEGAYVVKSKSIEDAELFARAVELKPGLEPNFVIPVAYDGAKVVINALEQAGTNPIALKNAMANTNIPGRSTSVVSFDEQGDIEQVEFEYYVIQNNELQPLA